MRMERPVMIYDGDCEFCRRWVRRWKRLTGGRVDYEAYQEVLEKFPQVRREECVRAVQFVEVDGKVYGAAEGVLRALRYGKGLGWLYWCYRKSGLFAEMAEGVYRWVARNR